MSRIPDPVCTECQQSLVWDKMFPFAWTQTQIEFQTDDELAIKPWNRAVAPELTDCQMITPPDYEKAAHRLADAAVRRLVLMLDSHRVRCLTLHGIIHGYLFLVSWKATTLDIVNGAVQ